jgi:peptidoglycan/LPS O-acetylase OafA/YrhL
MQTVNGTYISRVDQLRFLAAGLVVCYHSFHLFTQSVATPSPPTSLPVMNLISEGYMGVSIFMVLSGFIFTVISYGNNVAYGKFIYNRVLRIYPLLIFVMLLEIYMNRPQYPMLTIFSFLLPFSNMGQGIVSGVAAPMWTIAVEFQFYLIFPFLIAFVLRKGTRYLWGLMLVLLITRGLAYVDRGSVQDLAYYTNFGRLDQLIIGMACGILYLKNPKRFGNPWWLLAGGIVALTYSQIFAIFGGYYGHRETSVMWVFWPELEALAWACFIIPFIECRIGYGQYLEKVLANFGKYSYSIYALHVFVALALGHVLIRRGIFHNQHYGPLLFSVGLILPATVALAALSYHIIEAPFLSMRVKYASTEPIESALISRAASAVPPGGFRARR